jgi:PAS domain S-box-containing protein
VSAPPAPPAPPVGPGTPAGPDEQSVYRSLFAAYPDALLLTDRQGLIVRANPAAEQLLGYPAAELAGLSVDALVPDAIRPRHAAYRDAYDRSPRARPMGTQMALVAKRRDGSEVMVEIALSPVQIDGQAFVVAAVRGVEAYPRVRQALQRARYSEFVAQMGRLAVDARDPQLLLAQVPAVAADALRVDMAVLCLLEPNRLEFRVAGGVGLLDGEGLDSAIPNRPGTPPGFVLAQGAPVTVSDYRLEQRFTVPPAYLAGELVSALAVPLTDRGQTIGTLSVSSRQPERFGPDELHFLESLSNLLAASLQRVQTEEALSHAQRLESVGQLTGGIAHDFNNLLTVIQGNLQVLEEHPALAGQAGAQQLLAAAARAGRRGAELTGKLLAFSRRQLLSPVEVDVAELLEALANMLRRTLDQRILIEVQVPPGGLRCLADGGQLDAALLNIAINARDAMPEGGRLAFSARAVGALPVEVAAELGEAARAGRYAEITVADTGHGMSEAVRERAFEPFFTTKELGRGTGLGLSTVYGFVKQSRGAVRLQTAPGEGTCLALYLPRVEAAGALQLRSEPGGDALPNGLDVLLVEDEPEVLAVAEHFLRSLGCRVTAFAAAEPALASVEGACPHDLLLTDIALGPGLRGTELARQLQGRFPALAVLLTSGFSVELLQGEAAEALPWELLPKPYERAELARALVRALAAVRGAGGQVP